MRYLFNIIVTLTTPCATEEEYMRKADTLATALHDVLASKEPLLDLCKATEEMIQEAHVECEVSRDGEDTLVASAILDIEASAPMQLNKPLLTKAFKTKVGGLGKMRVEKRLLVDNEA